MTTSAKDWDARYQAASGGLFGESPNDYLCSLFARADWQPRSALMLADGDGRNGAWVAAQGLSVLAVDLSAEATRRARERDVRLGVRVEREAADLGLWSPPGGRRFDLATIIYLQANEQVRRRAVEMGASALRRGGWLVLEGFSKLQAPEPAMGPDSVDKLYDIDELRAWIPQLDIVESLVGQVRLDEGPRHRGLAHVVRYLARAN